MANLGNNVKTAFLKGLEALGKTASNLTDAAQQKLSEMNLETRRRELLSEIPKCVMQLWKEGAEMPEPLSALLNELDELNQQLAAMRPQPEEKEEAPAEPVECNAEENDEENSEESPEEPVENCEEACEETCEETAEDTACSCEENSGSEKEEDNANG